MMTHTKRLAGLVLFALIEAAVLLLPVFDLLDAATAEKTAQALFGLLTLLGLIDAGVVEARRRNPAIPALVDDVRDTRTRRRPGSLVEPYPPLPAPPPDPPSGALGLVLIIVAAACSVATSGCGAGALGAQADMIAFGGIAAAEADEVLVGARARDLDAVLERARTECPPGGCDDARAEHHRAELAAAEARWAPVLACRAPVVEALRSWLEGLETAHQAATDDVGLALLLRLGARFVAAYGALVSCVEAAAPDVDLPGLPPALGALASGGAR